MREEIARGPRERLARVMYILVATSAAVFLVWVLIGLADRVRLVIVPLVLALFPAVILAPVVRWLKSAGWPPALAAFSVITGVLIIIVAFLFTIGSALHRQLDDLGDQLRAGYDDLRRWLMESPLSVDPGEPTELWTRIRTWAFEGEAAAVDPSTVATAVVEYVSALLLGLAALFFYLKDGSALVAWLPRLLPAPWDRHVIHVGSAIWDSIGRYFRGQLFVALIDAVFIGVGIAIVGVPLALPLAALVFVGGFFPIIGATVTGFVAALVALAEGGIGKALIVVAIVLAVQQLEGNVLEPFVVGRATRLHPLLTLVVLAAGALAFGLLGAFLAVPVAAALMRSAEYAYENRRRAVARAIEA